MAPTQVLCPTQTISFAPIKRLKRDYIHGNGRMFTNPIRLTHAWSMNNLSSELLALVFEQLRDVDPQSLASARLLSRRFNDIITPIKYEYFRLTERLISPQSQAHLPYALENVYAHTKHVEVRSNIAPDGVKRFLEQIRLLLSVRWRYVTDEFRAGVFWLPSDILALRNAHSSRTKLYVDGLPLSDYIDSKSHDTYLKAIPAHMLVSLKMASSNPPLTTRLGPLKRLVLDARNLAIFHYHDKGQGTRFTFAPDERMPAFKELSLRSYDWNYSAKEVEDHWDFSRIRRLLLVDVPIFQFLRSAPFEDLLDLHTLHCEDFSAHLPDCRSQATEDLYELVKRIRALHTLRITCRTQLFPVDALLRHAPTLETLRFRDHVDFGDEAVRCPTVRIDDLVQLSRGLYNLQSLEIDMDTAYCEPPLFLRALCGFSRLHTLTLHVQTVVRAFEVVPDNVDGDLEACMKMFEFLVRGKQGSAWRSITINVGGWRRIMVRRLAEAWRELNARGIYAERCIILERDPATGQMRVREEMPTTTN